MPVEILERSQAGAPTSWFASGVGKVRQIIIDTSTFRVHIMDGVTPGGYELAFKSEVDAVAASVDEITTALENIILANKATLPEED